MRLLVVRLGSLGDLVHTLPAVAALHRADPGTEIDWLVDAPHVEFLSLVPTISSIVTLHERTPSAWLDVRRRLRARAYDVAADFQGLVKSAALARLSGAARVMGFDRASLREAAASWFYSEQVDVGEGRHVIIKNLRLAAAIGAIRAEGEPLEFPLREVASGVLDGIRARAGERFALVNCGAAWPNKRWPPERFGELASRVREQHGLTSVVLWGPSEQAIATAVADASSGAAIVAPATSLTDLVAIARAATLLISGDTGPTHIAGAVGTPIVALFGPTDPDRNGPWAADDLTISRYRQCDCHYERTCRRDAARWCLADVTVDEVESAVAARLRAAGARA